MTAITTEWSKPNEVTLILCERFDFSVVEAFRQSYEALSVKNNVQVLVDFRRTRYMDSGALGMLLHMKQFFDTYQARITLINTSERIKTILLMSHFERKFNIQ